MIECRGTTSIGKNCPGVRSSGCAVWGWQLGGSGQNQSQNWLKCFRAHWPNTHNSLATIFSCTDATGVTIYLIMRKDLRNHMKIHNYHLKHSPNTHNSLLHPLYKCNWCEYTSKPQATIWRITWKYTIIDHTPLHLSIYINCGAAAKLSASSLESNMRAMV